MRKICMFIALACVTVFHVLILLLTRSKPASVSVCYAQTLQVNSLKVMNVYQEIVETSSLLSLH